MAAMGALDDAIREHLELKRRLGASEDEVQRKEQEAFGRGSATQPAAEPAQEMPSGADDAPPSSEPLADPTEIELPPEPPLADLEVNGNGVATAPLPDELEPDEVLPEESLEPEHSTRSSAVWDDEPEPEDEPKARDEPEEDVLEATPDFLEETSDQDQLWFEQKSPKDFDFD